MAPSFQMYTYYIEQEYTVRYSWWWRPLIKVAPPNTFCSFILKEYQIFKTAQLQTIMLELIKDCEFVIVIYVKLNEGTTCSEGYMRPVVDLRFKFDISLI
jgi:hypothetical protein